MSSGQSKPATATGDDPFHLGWRYVREVGPDGAETTRQVPLTQRDLLFPQEGDFVVQCDAHIRDWVYLREAFRQVFRNRPGLRVFADHRIDFNIPDVEPLGPDVAVLADLPEWDGTRGTIYLAREGRPLVVFEVTSPETRRNDLGIKIDFYQNAGVPIYVIVDRCGGDTGDEVAVGGYELDASGVYQTLARTDQNRIWVEPLGVYLGIERDQVWAYDRAGTRIEEAARLAEQVEEARLRQEELEEQFEQQVEARQAADRARIAAEQARLQAEQERQTAEQARLQAEQERQTAEQARAEAEQGLASAELSRQNAEQARAEAERARSELAEQLTREETARRQAEEAAAERAAALRLVEEKAATEAAARFVLEQRLRELEAQLRQGRDAP